MNTDLMFGDHLVEVEKRSKFFLLQMRIMVCIKNAFTYDYVLEENYSNVAWDGNAHKYNICNPTGCSGCSIITVISNHTLKIEKISI